MTIYRISCFNENKELQHFNVPKEIYIYVRQLECYANYPEISKLNELYPFRFSSEGHNNSIRPPLCGDFLEDIGEEE